MSLKEQYFKYSIIILILGLGIVIFFELIPFLGGLLGACTIYTLIRNQMKHLVEKRKMKRSIAAFLLIMETVLCFLIPISLVVWFLIMKVQHINLDPQVVLAPVEQISVLIKQKIGYDILNTDNLKSVISWAPQVGQMLMGGITSLALNIFVLIFVLYFMLLGNDKMENYIMDILPFTIQCHRYSFISCDTGSSSHVGILYIQCSRLIIVGNIDMLCDSDSYYRYGIDLGTFSYLFYHYRRLVGCRRVIDLCSTYYYTCR